MKTPWKLSETEWRDFGAILSPEGASLDIKRKAAEACLFRYFHMLGKNYPTFGWNELPSSLGVSPSTANRRFRQWTASGEWLEFWDAVTERRYGAATVPSREKGVCAESPVRALISELERAFVFFNSRFFGGTLPKDIAIAIERPGRRFSGYYCSRFWMLGKKQLGHIAITTTALGGRPEVSLEVLLHEMVHLRNDHFGIKDTNANTQYHNRFFRDVAQLVGLTCCDRHLDRGYGETSLNARGKKAIDSLQPDEAIFRWKTIKGVKTN